MKINGYFIRGFVLGITCTTVIINQINRNKNFEKLDIDEIVDRKIKEKKEEEKKSTIEKTGSMEIGGCSKDENTGISKLDEDVDFEERLERDYDETEDENYDFPKFFLADGPMDGFKTIDMLFYVDDCILYNQVNDNVMVDGFDTLFGEYCEKLEDIQLGKTDETFYVGNNMLGVIYKVVPTYEEFCGNWRYYE